MYCERCGKELSGGSHFCEFCGYEINYGHSFIAGTVSNATAKMFDAVGVADVPRFKLKDLLADVFRRHSEEEIESRFLVGTMKTTPSILRVRCEWPKPWMFFRCLIASVFLYLLFSIALDYFENPNLIPGLVFLGSVAMPLSASIFFFELNVWRNISLLAIGKFIVAGGVISILIASLFFSLYENELSWLSMAAAGLIEEPAKLAALVFMARGCRYAHKLNGLVLGAAIGTGFAIFESMGYSTFCLICSDNLADGIAELRKVTILRGVLSPFCHVVWTAIAGAALWRVSNGQLQFGCLFKFKFLRLFAIPVLFHMAFNFSIERGVLAFLVLPIEAILIWKLIIALADEGIKEVSLVKKTIRKE